MFSSCNKNKSSRLQRFSPTNFYHQKQQYSYSKMVKTLPIILCILSIFSTGNGAVVLQRNEGSNSVKNELAAYDNEIISEPEITCGPGVVHFTVNTRRGNASAVYVRGQSHNEDCTFHNKRNVTIELAKCNVRRKREINPNPGIAYQMTIVVQLHPLFVTKVDRAYNVNCFYKEKPQDVSVDFGVSDIVTQQLYSEPLLPACTYSVHRQVLKDSPNGPRVKYTHVGEQLYHVWECPSRMYSMLLYNCQAVDGKGAEFAIIDANGCSKDEFLMPQITYTVERTKAMAASAAFNFPDRNTMSFTCKIKLCMNSDLECNNLTPPNCNGKRAKSASNGNFNEDTSGESSALLNVTETPLPSSSSTTPLSIITKTNVKQRVEVSGDVIPETEFGTTMEAITATSTNKHKQDLRNEERIEEKAENSRSTLSSSTTDLRFSSSTSTESTRSDRNKPTIKEESDEEQQRTSSSTPRSSSSASRSSSSTTTSEGSEQLLSSVERMNSASAENSRETVASSTWSSSSTTEGIPLPPTLIATFHTTNSNNIISPKKDEFPQPDLLLHKDKAMLVPPERKILPSASKTSNRMDEAVERADPNWTVSAEEVKQEEEKEKKENDDVFNGTTKPVQVFDKRSGNEAKSAARSQRDTTRGPPASLNAGDGKRAHNRRRGTHEVDFDISSPELMIMDDYEPAAAAQRGSIQRSSIQEAPFIDWSTQERGNNTVVCLSPIAIISGGLLLLLLLLIMLVILMRVMRKNRGSSGTLMEHSLYSS